jgi:DNA helicase IV
VTDPVLAAETEHLERARQCLVTMQASAAAIADYGVDELASQSLGRMRAQRLKALTADPDAPPFFGRTDRDDAGVGAAAGSAKGEALHIGRRHVRDLDLNPVVIDWRAPISRAFYQATPADRMGVTLRRRFGFGRGAAAGRLTSYEDEHLDRGEDLGLHSQILRTEIERPRVGPMRDIVSTIQPDQDELVRADLDVSLCIQGSPGTGKTAVGLHRAAYLLYTYPERLRRTGVLVVGPNAAFLNYIAQVLPALGEGGIAQATVDELVSSESGVRAASAVADPPDVAVLKGDARMADVLLRAVRSHIARPVEDVVAIIGTRRYRVGAHHLRRYVDDARRELGAGELRWNAGRDRLRLQVAEDVRRQREAVGGAPTDAETRKLANAAPVREAVDAVWAPLTAPGLLARLYTDASFLARCAAALDPQEQALLAWPAQRARGRPTWSGPDRVLLDELTGILDGTASYVHVVVDEAQDLSAMQCRAVARRSPLGSLTVLGDLAQATTPWAPGSWPATLAHLGRPEAGVRPLTTGYRVPGAVLDVANRLLVHIAPDLPPATSVRAGSYPVEYAPRSELAAAVRRCAELDGSIGVIVVDASATATLAELRQSGVDAVHVADDSEDAESADTDPGDAAQTPRISVVPASEAKGLEFDSVVVVEPEHIVAGESARINGLRRLYVVLTRAVSRLVVVADEALPSELTP